MQDLNPYAPPQSNVEAEADAYADIENLPVSATWKRRFVAIRRCGGPKLPLYKNVSRAERRDVMRFNLLAFLFGPFYYFSKGMWRRGLALFAAIFAVILVVDVVLDLAGYGRFGKYLGYGAAAVFAVRANIDYYKKMVLRDNGWW